MPNIVPMIPMNYPHSAQESHLRRLEQQQLQHQHHQQRQLSSALSAYAGASRPMWIPSMVSFPVAEQALLSSQHHRHHQFCQPIPRTVPQPPAAVPSSTMATSAKPETALSADEVCAASVLISFAPKDKSVSSSSRMASPVPCLEVPKTIAEDSPGHVTDSSESSAASTAASHSMMEEDASICPSTVAAPATTEAVAATTANQEWHAGCISLSLPEDEEVLSPLHCFMRRYCVEAFTAAPEDVATPRYGKSHGLKVVAGQVGIRCLYCKHRPMGKRPERAVCYPSSLKNIYHSIETWQRRHSLVCPDIPAWVRTNMIELMESSKSRAGGRRQYWEDSATRIGMIDTPAGVRFCREPGAIQLAPSDDVSGFTPKKVVEQDDREMVTDYLFLLMDQMETCQFTEEDRSGGRSKIKNNHVGFPGMQCKHCQGKAGFGRYFPSSVNALALANSDRNINNHLQKCRRCPPEIKQELIRLNQDQSQGKNRRGLRKLFFRRVWERMHGPMDA